MKVLLVHNYYGSSAPSGENTVYAAEVELLKKRGHTVIEYTRQSDEIRNQGLIGLVKGALSTAWNPFSQRLLRELLRDERPDVMHAHNTFPLLSPSVFYAAKGLTTATVLTLHNYRIFCAAAIPMRDNLPCTECLDRRSTAPALLHGCYRNSTLATVPLSAMIALHRRMKTWSRHVDAFIALTSFQRDTLVDAGLRSDLVYVKPHFYINPPEPLPWQKRETKIIFIGRLGPEKGLRFLIDAWRQWGPEAPEIEVIGAGSEMKELITLAGDMGLAAKITFSGQLPFAETQLRLARARLLVLPSLCFEGFPMVVREAYALGVPVAASRLGSLPCIVSEGETGLLFKPGDAGDLLSKVRGAWKNGERLEAMGKAARKEFEQKYSADAHYEALMYIYEKAIGRRKLKVGKRR